MNWFQEMRSEIKPVFMFCGLLLVSSLLDYYTGLIIRGRGTSVASDLLLDLIPVIDVTPIYLYGFLFIFVLLFAWALQNPHLFKRVLGHFSLLTIVHSLFVPMTHLRPPAEAVTVQWPGVFANFTFTHQYFFSAHVAVPFLAFLVFEGKIRWFFLVLTVLMVASVFMMHTHYSIDVFAAFFITYGTYRMGRWLFSTTSAKPSS